MWYDGKTIVNKYTVVWNDHSVEKVKIGVFSDKMHVRYGPATYGTLKGTEPTGLWQSRGGTVKQYELDEMIAVAKGESTLPAFDVEILKELNW